MTTDDDMRATAHHEAGHYVVDQVLGRVVGAISIIPDGITAARSSCEDDCYVMVSANEMRIDPERVRAQVIGLYAGAAAGRRWGNDAATEALGARSDYEDAETWLDKVGAGHDVAEKLKEEAARLVELHWSVITTIADALLEHRFLCADHAQMLYEVATGEADPADGTVAFVMERAIEQSRECVEAAVRRTDGLGAS